MNRTITKRYLGLRQEDEILELYDLAKPLTGGIIVSLRFFLMGGGGGYCLSMMKEVIFL